MLAAAGADVVHVPLIAIESVDGLAADLRRLDEFDWLVVTSQHGAERVGAAAASCPGVRLAAVGSSTSAALEARAGRVVDVVPDRQTGAELVEALAGERRGRVMVAQADRADDTVVDGLRAAGFDVEAVTAYRTVLREPTWRERTAALGADAVGFASGSAAAAWVSTIGTTAPPVVAAIGPTTAAAAARLGLQITHTAADHDVDGLVAAISTALTSSS
jgi:uroporphyrinogen-III synthase